MCSTGGTILNTLREQLVTRFKEEKIALPIPKPPVTVTYQEMPSKLQ